MYQAISRLQLKEVLGRVQDLRQPAHFWAKATREQGKTMVVEEVSQVVQDRYLVKAISQASREHGLVGRIRST